MESSNQSSPETPKKTWGLLTIPFHPLLIGIAPVAILFADNLLEVTFGAALRAFLVSFLFASLFYLTLVLLYRNWSTAGIVSSVMLILFFTYGHIYHIIKQASLLEGDLKRHLYMLPVTLLLYGLIFWWGWKEKNTHHSLTRLFNVVSLILVALPLIRVVAVASRSLLTRAEVRERGYVTVEGLPSNVSNPNESPDIYYIILDGYARADVLEEYFDLDNTPFLTELERHGFTIASCSQSNYTLTSLSMSSTLNMSYLDSFPIDLEHANLNQVGEFAKTSVLRRFLEGLGYKTIAFESGYFVSEWSDADLYLSNAGLVKKPLSGLNSFEAMYLSSTIGRILLDGRKHLPDSLATFLDYAYTEHRERTLFILEQLQQVPSLQLGGPKFVMAHVLAPHPPFVFGPDGEIITQRETFSLKDDILPKDREDYIAGYRDQVRYINQRMLHLMDVILGQSETPPIIILQGDHGAGRRMTSDHARTAILNAFHLPGNAQERIYASITPVNSFRLIMNEYFGTELALLDDVSRLSIYGAPFNFTRIPEQNPECP
jgi:hypothetical protein